MKLEELAPLRLLMNLEYRVDRLAAVAPRLAAASVTYERHVAIPKERVRDAGKYASIGKRATAMTKRLALRKAALRGAEAVLLLEDDVVFCEDFQARVDALEVPDDWAMIYLGCIHYEPPKAVAAGLVRVSRCFDNHAVIIRASCFLKARRAMRRVGEETGRCSDVLLSNLHKHVPTYAAWPNLAWQAESFSDLNEEVYSNYLADGSQKIWLHTLKHL